MYAAPQQPSSYSHQPAAGLLHLLQQTCHHCTCTCTCTRTLLLSFQPTHGWASTQQVHSKTRTHTTFVRRYTQPPTVATPHMTLPVAPVCAAAVPAASNACVCRVTGHWVLAPAVLLHGAQGDKKVHTTSCTKPPTASRESARAPAEPYEHPPHKTHCAHRSTQGGSAVHNTTACAAQRQPTNRHTHLSHTCHRREQHTALPTVVSHRSNSQRTAQHSTAQRVAPRRVSFGACLERHSSSVHVLCTVQGEAVVQHSARRRPCAPPGHRLTQRAAHSGLCVMCTTPRVRALVYAGVYSQ